MKNAKKKGNRNEHKSIKWLNERGCYCVRSGGSLGLFDIVALCPRGVELVQVKSNRWPGTVEQSALSQFVAPAYAAKFIHRWNDYARDPVVKKIP